MLPAYRNRGIGGQLLRALVEAETRPVHLVCLEKMRPYYERFGFRLLPFAQSPRTLMLKQAFGRAFGARVICMKRAIAPTACA